MANQKELISKQIEAIKRVIFLGRSLQVDSPEIADLYREGEGDGKYF